MVSNMSNGAYTGPRQTTLEPDDAVMFRFMHWWFGLCTAGAIELCWHDPAKGRLDLVKRFALDDINAAARFAADVNAIPGCSIYFRAATVQFTSFHTTDADVVQIPGAWGDADTPAAAQRTLHAHPIPSAVVVTGRHPGLRAQAFYRTTEPILVGETVRHLNRQARELVGGDGAVTNPSSLMRLPGSIAWPWKPGREIELTEWVTPDGGGDSLPLDALRTALPPVAAEAGAAGLNGHASATTELLNPIRGLIERARRGENWNTSMLQATGKMVARGYPDWMILALAEHVTLAGYTVEQTRAELADMVARAQRKGFGPGEPDGGEPDDGMMTDDEIDAVVNGPPKPEPEPTPEVISSDWWMTRELTRPVPVLGEVICASTRALIGGPTGAGKTHLAMAMAGAVAVGRGFLHWPGPARPLPTLYIDGEMARYRWRDGARPAQGPGVRSAPAAGWGQPGEPTPALPRGFSGYAGTEHGGWASIPAGYGRSAETRRHFLGQSDVPADRRHEGRGPMD
jgi:AAA domain